LTPLNECGVPKFICTTLRPSLPPFPQLYTLDGCAKFVSEFLTYEPLEDPLHPPSHLPSPMSVLQWQAADAFDAAVVLCSLLLGSGYNAFVVMGYAELAVTLNDQSQTECPYIITANASCCGSTLQAGRQLQQLSTGSGSGATAAPCPVGSSSSTSLAAATAPQAAGSKAVGSGAEAKGADEPGKRKKYQLRPKPQLESKFLQEHVSVTTAGLHPTSRRSTDADASMSVVSSQASSAAFVAFTALIDVREMLLDEHLSCTWPCRMAHSCSMAHTGCLCMHCFQYISLLADSHSGSNASTAECSGTH